MSSQTGGPEPAPRPENELQPAAAQVQVPMNQFARIAFAVLATLAGALLAWEFRSVLLLFAAAMALAAAIGPAALRLAARGMRRGFATTALVLLVVVGLLLVIGVSAYVLAEELPRAVTETQMRYAQVRNTLAEQTGWQGMLGSQLPAPQGLEDLVARTQSEPQEDAASQSGDQSGPAAVSDEAASGTENAQATPPAGGQPVSAVPAGDTSDATAPATTATSAADAGERRVSGMLRLLAGTTSSVLGLFGQFIVLVFLSLYWSLEREWFERLWLSLLPANKRRAARRAWNALDEGVGAHVRSEAMQTVVAFILLYGGFSLMGAGYPLLMAWAAALAWMIPLLGWLVAVVPILVLGVLAGPWIAVGAILYMTLILGLLEFVIEPRLDMRRRAGSIMGLVVALVILQAFGIVGLLVAGPVAVAIQLIAAQWSLSRYQSVPLSEDVSIAQIEAHLAALRAAMGNVEEDIPLHTRSLYERLQTLMIEAEEAL